MDGSDGDICFGAQSRQAPCHKRSDLCPAAGRRNTEAELTLGVSLKNRDTVRLDSGDRRMAVFTPAPDADGADVSEGHRSIKSEN